jgi:hypothetical protein
MHREKGTFDFVLREGPIKGGETQNGVRIQGVQVKSPLCLAGSPEQGVIEFKKKADFLIVTKNFQPIMLEDLNLIVPEPLRCTSMEVPCVFITFDGCPYFASLFPTQQLFFD